MSGRRGSRGALPGPLLPLALLPLLLAVLPASGRGQTGQALSLDEALQRAVENNPNYRRTLNNLVLSDVERQQAWGAFLPTLSVSSATGVSLNRQLVSTDEFGNPVQNPFTDWRTSSSTSQSINASLSLYQWGARRRDMATQKAQAKAREAAVTAESRGLRADVIRAYRTAQNQQALLGVEQSLLASRELDLETTQRMFVLAGASRVDVLTAELNVQQQGLRIQEAQGQLQQALLNLRTVIGDEGLNDFTVDGTLPEAYDPSGLDPGSLGSRAFSSNPNLIQQEATVEASRAQTQSARRAHWPPLTISFNARQSTYSDEYAAFMSAFPNDSRSGGASFGITIPIFQGFNNKARIVQAEVALANQEEALRETRLLVEEAVQSRLIALETAYQSYVITLRSRDIAQERLRLGREQFRLGARTFTELQQDIDAASQAERAVINQLFALEQALANLEEMVGEELR
jgi:outer membrane protein TolC